MDLPAALGRRAADDGPAGVQTVTVSEEDMQRANDLYLSNPIVQACKETLNAQLFAGRVHVSDGDHRLELRDDFADFLTEQFGLFGRQVVDALRTFGFAPCCIARHEDGVNRVPLVPPCGSYTVRMTTRKDFGRTLQIFAKGHANPRPVPNSFVYVVSYPTPRGHVVSPVATLAKHVARVDALARAAVECDVAAARPTLFMQERNKTAHISTQAQAAATGVTEWFAAQGAANTDEMAALQQRRRDEELARRVLAQRNLANKRNAADMAGDGPQAKPIGTAEGAGDLAASLMLLPGGLEIAPHSSRQTNQNLEREQAILTDTICGVMGVPNSLIHPASSTYNSGGLVQRIVNAEMKIQATHIAAAFKRAYQTIYGHAADDTAAADRPQNQKQKQNPPRADADAHADAAKSPRRAQQTPRREKTALNCYLVFPPFLEVETLLAIANTQLFKQKYMATLIAHGAGFYERGVTEKFIQTTPPPDAADTPHKTTPRPQKEHAKPPQTLTKDDDKDTTTNKNKQNK
jgi:hypothetical protein